MLGPTTQKDAECEISIKTRYSKGIIVLKRKKGKTIRKYTNNSQRGY